MKRYFWLEKLNEKFCFMSFLFIRIKKEEDEDDERGNRKVYDIIVKCTWLKYSDVCYKLKFLRTDILNIKSGYSSLTV